MQSMFSHRPRRRSPLARSAGFSVMEMLIVIGVIGVVAGIGLPSLFQQLTRNRIEAAANNVGNLMRQTRLRAIRDNASYTVQMVDSAGLPVAVADADTRVEGVGVFDDVTLEFTGSTITVYTGAGPACTEFESDGTAGHYGVDVTYESSGTASDPGAICVEDGSGNILQVAVDSTTGQPRIRKYLPSAHAPGGNAGFYLKATGSTADPDTWGTDVWVWF